MRPFHLCVIASCAIGCLQAQLELDASSEQGRKAAAAFESVWNDAKAPALACEVEHYNPTLDYGLRIWAGFRVAIRAQEFQGPVARRAAIVVRVTPRGQAAAKPTYLWMPFDPPREIPKNVKIKNVELRTGGGFYLGAGKYQVEWLMADDGGRRCKASWKVTARAKGASHIVAAGTVEAMGQEIWPGFQPVAAGERGSRATIFLHAAPIWPRRVVAKLSPWDRQILLSTLNSLLRDGQFTSACVVVFDLERRSVLYRDEAFDRRGMRRLMRQLTALDLSTIDMATLKQGPNPKPFLEDMLRQELKAPNQSDAFVFVGPTWRAGPKVSAIEPALREAVPPTWFLAFTPRGFPYDGDSVGSLVRSVKGKVVPIYGPSDLAGGIRSLAMR